MAVVEAGDRRSGVWLTTGNIPIMSRGGTEPAPDVFSPSGATSILRSDNSASAHRG